MIRASPWPPPPQIAAPPRSTPRRRISCASVSTRRAPLAPIGWPSATAPPFTFTMSSSDARACGWRCSDTAANASLISMRPRSWTSSPAFFSAFCSAMRRHRVQVREAVRRHAVRHDLRDRLQAELVGLLARLVTTTAAAPSEICEALPAVIGPALLERGPQLRERLGRGVGADALVAGDDDRVARALRDLDRDDLLGERARLPRRVRALVRARRPRVLVLARDAELRVHLVGGRRPCAAR